MNRALALKAAMGAGGNGQQRLLWLIKGRLLDLKDEGHALALQGLYQVSNGATGKEVFPVVGCPVVWRAEALGRWRAIYALA